MESLSPRLRGTTYPGSTNQECSINPSSRTPSSLSLYLSSSLVKLFNLRLNNPPTMQLVLDYLARNQSRFINELIEHASFPSVSAQPRHKPDLLANARWLLAHC